MTPYRHLVDKERSMYVNPNYKSKKDFVAAVVAGVQHEIYNPSYLFPVPQNGESTVEGPHYPQPHKWYAAVKIKDGIVVTAK